MGFLICDIVGQWNVNATFKQLCTYVVVNVWSAFTVGLCVTIHYYDSSGGVISI